MTIFRKLWTLSSPDLFRPWMFALPGARRFKYLKKRQRWPDHLRDDDALERSRHRSRPERDRGRSAPAGPARDTASRAVLALHFKEGITLPEVAAMLDIPLGTVKSRWPMASRRCAGITQRENK